MRCQFGRYTVRSPNSSRSSSIRIGHDSEPSPNHIEDARLDAIALSLDIRELAFRHLRALREGDWPSVVLLNCSIDARARSIQEHMNEMKRRNQRRRNAPGNGVSEREVP